MTVIIIIFFQLKCCFCSPRIPTSQFFNFNVVFFSVVLNICFSRWEMALVECNIFLNCDSYY